MTDLAPVLAVAPARLRRTARPAKMPIVLPVAPRPLLGLLVGAIGVLLVSLVAIPLDEDSSRVVPALLLVVPVVVAAVLGGRAVALVVSGAAGLCLATAFLPPIGSPRVAVGEDVVALVVFAVVAVVVGTLVASVVAAEERRIAAETARAEALGALDAQRRSLLRSVSHDLRTPLGLIRTAASELEEPTTADDARPELAALIGEEAERLDRIVANLMSLSRIEAGAFRPDCEPCAVADLVAVASRRLAGLAGRRELVVELPTVLPLVDVDPVQIDQALTNLTENALRHARHAVRIGASATATSVRITVLDDGPGIDPSLAGRLFEPFSPAGGSTTTGVGLATARAIVEAHGGTIGGGDGPDGTCFWFTLPVAT